VVLPTPVTSHFAAHNDVPSSADNQDDKPTVVARIALRGVDFIRDDGAVAAVGLGESTIGRALDAQVRLPEQDREVSRRHAAVIVAPSEARIEDRSQNGTFVNGERVSGARMLQNGDRVRCGSTTFTVRLVR
jgi:pSer/pThr/pTyr-binding forkhead associated (FHA) protein